MFGLAVQVSGLAEPAVPACSPLPLLFSLWNPCVDVAGAQPVDDEMTRMPYYLTLWAASPAFPCWHVDRYGRTVYSPTGYFDALFGLL